MMDKNKKELLKEAAGSIVATAIVFWLISAGHIAAAATFAYLTLRFGHQKIKYLIRTTREPAQKAREERSDHE